MSIRVGFAPASTAYSHVVVVRAGAKVPALAAAVEERATRPLVTRASRLASRVTPEDVTDTSVYRPGGNGSACGAAFGSSRAGAPARGRRQPSGSRARRFMARPSGRGGATPRPYRPGGGGATARRAG